LTGREDGGNIQAALAGGGQEDAVAFFVGFLAGALVGLGVALLITSKDAEAGSAAGGGA